MYIVYRQKKLDHLIHSSLPNAKYWHNRGNILLFHFMYSIITHDHVATSSHTAVNEYTLVS